MDNNDQENEYVMDDLDLSNFGADGHSDKRKRRKLAKYRNKCKKINAPTNDLISYLYHQLYIPLSNDLTNIPYYLKYIIKYIFEFNSHSLKFKRLIHLLAIVDVDLHKRIQMMMEFSVILGFHFMPKRPLLIMCNDIYIDIRLVIYILENKIDIMTDQVFYTITKQLINARNQTDIAGIKHIITHYYPLERFFKFIETWKTKNLTTWWIKPSNHVVGMRLNWYDHIQTLVMVRVIKVIKLTKNIEYFERALQIFIGLATNSITFRKSRHSKISLVGLITNIMQFRNYSFRMRYTKTINISMALIDCNINGLIKAVPDYNDNLLKFKKINEQCNNLQMLVLMCSKLNIIYDIKRYITSYLI